MFCLAATFHSAKKKQEISHINQYYIIKSITILMEIKLTKNKDNKDKHKKWKMLLKGGWDYSFALTNRIHRVCSKLCFVASSQWLQFIP